MILLDEKLEDYFFKIIIYMKRIKRIFSCIISTNCHQYFKEIEKSLLFNCKFTFNQSSVYSTREMKHVDLNKSIFTERVKLSENKAPFVCCSISQ